MNGGCVYVCGGSWGCWSSGNLRDDDADDYDSQYNTDHSHNDLLLQGGVETKSQHVWRNISSL